MSKLSIMPLKGNTYYMPSPTNIGIYVLNGEVTLIDSGLDKEVAKQILKVTGEAGWVIKNIINTHSHADHIGGNAFLREKTGCNISAPFFEAPFIENPSMEPALLYGGFPHKILRNKFIMAQPSIVYQRVKGPTTLSESGIRILPLPGHSMDMIGAMTPDNVCFIADSLFTESIVKKYSLTYLWDIETHLKTLENMKQLEADLFVPGHGEPLKCIKHLCDANKEKVEEIAQKILEICKAPITMEAVLEKLCIHYDIKLNATQYVLLSNTLRSYLSYLNGIGKIEAAYEGHKMTWLMKQL